LQWIPSRRGPVVGVALDADDGVDLPGLQHGDGDLRHDPRPLRRPPRRGVPAGTREAPCTSRGRILIAPPLCPLGGYKGGGAAQSPCCDPANTQQAKFPDPGVLHVTRVGDGGGMSNANASPRSRTAAPLGLRGGVPGRVLVAGVQHLLRDAVVPLVRPPPPPMHRRLQRLTGGGLASIPSPSGIRTGTCVTALEWPRRCSQGFHTGISPWLAKAARRCEVGRVSRMFSITPMAIRQSKKTMSEIM